MKIVKPDLIICNGYGENNSYTNSSFSILKEKLNITDSDINKELKSDNNLKYFKKQIDFINPLKETLIIGVSHLSYYNKNYNPEDLFYKTLKNVLLKNT